MLSKISNNLEENWKEGSYSSNFRKRRDPFVPPKPKELLRAYTNSVVRDVLGT